MFRQQLMIHARLVIKALEVGRTDEFDQVIIALGIRRQQRQMKVRLLAGGATAIAHGTSRHIGLATDDRLDPGLFRRLVKLDRAKEVAVVGHRHGRHLVFSSLF